MILIPVTNAIEALNSKLRRAVRTRGHFPSDDAAAKLLYLVLNHGCGLETARRANGSRRRRSSPLCSKSTSCSHDGKLPHTQKFRQSRDERIMLRFLKESRNRSCRVLEPQTSKPCNLKRACSPKDDSCSMAYKFFTDD